jgi:hypothetical protein
MHVDQIGKAIAEQRGLAAEKKSRVIILVPRSTEMPKRDKLQALISWGHHVWYLHLSSPDQAENPLVDG